MPRVNALQDLEGTDDGILFSHLKIAAKKKKNIYIYIYQHNDTYMISMMYLPTLMLTSIQHAVLWKKGNSSIVAIIKYKV